MAAVLDRPWPGVRRILRSAISRRTRVAMDTTARGPFMMRHHGDGTGSIPHLHSEKYGVSATLKRSIRIRKERHASGERMRRPQRRDTEHGEAAVAQLLRFKGARFKKAVSNARC